MMMIVLKMKIKLNIVLQVINPDSAMFDLSKTLLDPYDDAPVLESKFKKG